LRLILSLIEWLKKISCSRISPNHQLKYPRLRKIKNNFRFGNIYDLVGLLKILPKFKTNNTNFLKKHNESSFSNWRKTIQNRLSDKGRVSTYRNNSSHYFPRKWTHLLQRMRRVGKMRRSKEPNWSGIDFMNSNLLLVLPFNVQIFHSFVFYWFYFISRLTLSILSS